MNNEHLIGLLNSPDAYVRADAALKLGEHKSVSAEARLRAMCQDTHKVAALAAYQALWNMGRKYDSIDLLLESLASEDEETIQFAVQIVTQIGEPLLEHVPDALMRPNTDIDVIAMMLEEVGGTHALDILKQIPCGNDSELSSLINEMIDDWD